MGLEAGEFKSLSLAFGEGLVAHCNGETASVSPLFSLPLLLKSLMPSWDSILTIVSNPN